ncbi:hypothetical protein ACWLMY_30115 [Streptomyces anulatus]
MAAARATPHTGQIISGTVAPQSSFWLSKAPWKCSRMYMTPAIDTRTETSVAGTTARLNGTRRPLRPTAHRGKTSPQRRTRPRVSSEPSAPMVASAAPAIQRLSFLPSSHSSSEMPSGMPRAQAHRVLAYSRGTTTAVYAARLPQRAAASGEVQPAPESVRPQPVQAPDVRRW